MKYQRRLREWQFYWSSWWKLWPVINTYPADEYGPREQWVCIGPVQMRFELWRIG
jgi:hypothetical protein